MRTIVLIVNGLFMDFSSLFAPRVAAERKRLKLSQEEAASACGISREMWGKYERGKAVMGGEVLAMFSAVGADARYIITGDRVGPVPEVLSSDERVMLERYRDSPKPLRDAALRVLLGESPKSPRQVFHGDVGNSVNVEGDLKQSGVSFFGGETKKKK